MVQFNPGRRHPLYTKWRDKWRRQRHVIEGEDRIKQNDVATDYLPTLDGQTDVLLPRENSSHVLTSYQKYKARASFMNATGRTREGLVGAITRKEPDLNWPESQMDQLDVVGSSLESFDEITDEALQEVVGVGRYGQLVDMPMAGSGDNLAPFVASYHAETITDWDMNLLNGRKKVTRVNLLEASGLMHKTEKRELEQFRVLWLGAPMPLTEEEQAMGLEEFLRMWGLTPQDFSEGPVYFQEIWVEIEESEQKGSSDERSYSREQIIVPRMLGGGLWREIPFTFFNAENTRAKPTKPPLLDLVVVNLSHYRNSADLEHGLHFTALPQAWIAGFKFKDDLFIGSGAAWVSEDAGASAGYLEFTGEGLKAITTRMEEKKKEMAALGARLLEEQNPAGAAEAHETVKLRQSGERSVLSKISLTVSEGLTRTLKFLQNFKGVADPDVGILLNQDFGTEGMTPEMLTALMGQVQGGLMSWSVYVFNVRRGEMYPDGWTDEDEAKAIAAGPPRAPNALMEPLSEAEAPETDDPAEPLDEPGGPEA